MRLLKFTTIPAIVFVFLLLSGAAASASTEKSINGNVSCNDGLVTGVWVEAYSSESDWARWDVPVRAGGHNEADFRFTLNEGGKYKIHVGCSDPAQLFTDDWGTTVKSGWVRDANPEFECNSLEDWKFLGKGKWIKRFKQAYKATDPPEYGECAKVE